MTFEEVVAEWLRGLGYVVEGVDSVEGVGSDLDGDTMNGFHRSFATWLRWRGPGGVRRDWDVDGEDMESLWKHVVGAWGNHA
jgi:hypothetical protein